MPHAPTLKTDGARLFSEPPADARQAAPAAPSVAIPPHIQEAQRLADERNASRVPEFGDMVSTPTGKIGFIRGGSMGVNRVGVIGTNGRHLGHFNKDELKLISRQNVQNRPTPEADEIMRQIRRQPAATQTDYEGGAPSATSCPSVGRSAPVGERLIKR